MPFLTPAMGAATRMASEIESSDPSQPHRTWRRRVGAGTLFLIAFCVAVAGACMILEESFIFFPSRYPEGDWNPPNLRFEDVDFRSTDGTQLHGWYIPHAFPRAVILFSHGNGGNLSHRADTARILNELVGASVMMYDYRGYGRSEGSPCEKGIFEDARAARQWLAKREGIDPREVVLMGRSLGGAGGRRAGPGRHSRIGLGEHLHPPYRRWPRFTTLGFPSGS